MSISRHYNNTVEIKRVQRATGQFKMTYDAVSTTTKCHIQSMDDDNSELTPGRIGRYFLMFTDNLNIVVGDKVVDGAKTYEVTAVEIHDAFLGKTRHAEVTLKFFEEADTATII